MQIFGRLFRRVFFWLIFFLSSHFFVFVNLRWFVCSTPVQIEECFGCPCVYLLTNSGSRIRGRRMAFSGGRPWVSHKMQHRFFIRWSLVCPTRARSLVAYIHHCCCTRILNGCTSKSRVKTMYICTNYIMSGLGIICCHLFCGRRQSNNVADDGHWTRNTFLRRKLVARRCTFRIVFVPLRARLAGWMTSVEFLVVRLGAYIYIYL